MNLDEARAVMREPADDRVFRQIMAGAMICSAENVANASISELVQVDHRFPKSLLRMHKYYLDKKTGRKATLLHENKLNGGTWLTIGGNRM